MVANKDKSKLRITAGVSEGQEIDSEVAARFRGRTVGYALTTIIEDVIQDPELLSMLRDDRLALELYSQGDEGDCLEAPLSVFDEWDRVIENMKLGDVEVGIARSHAGGRRSVKVRRRNLALERRFPRQAVICHPFGHAITLTERHAVEVGHAVFIHGSVLAKVECICKELGGLEAFWYYVTTEEDPDVIVDQIIPKQRVSAASCKVDDGEDLKVGRRVRKLGLRVWAGGHSHGWSWVFSSQTDRKQMAELASESVGNITTTREMIKGEIYQHHSDNGRNILRASFDRKRAIEVHVKMNGAKLKKEDLEIELELTYRHIKSCFATHNSHGKHFFPILEVVSCPACGARRQQEYIDVKHVVVHVIGPVRITASEKEKVEDEVRNKVKSWSIWSWRGQTEEREQVINEVKDTTEDDHKSLISEDDDSCIGLVPFSVYHRNRLVAKIPAAVMERAAAETPELAAALDWKSS